MTDDIKTAVERMRNKDFDIHDRHKAACVLADAYLTLINRTPSESAKAAAEAVYYDLVGRKGVGNELEECDEEIQGEIKEVIAAIIQRHMPPVNERLLDSLVDVIDMLTNPKRAGYQNVNPESLMPVINARIAIAEARSAREA